MVLNLDRDRAPMERSASTNTLLQHIQQLQDEAYQRGWRDAMNSIRQLLDAAPEAEPKKQAPTALEHQAPRRARKGSVPTKILSVLERKDGLTYEEIGEEFVAMGTPSPAGSTRSGMRRLVEDGLVTRRHNRWFLVRQGHHRSAEQETPDAVTSGAPTGGHHGIGGQNDGTALDRDDMAETQAADIFG